MKRLVILFIFVILIFTGCTNQTVINGIVYNSDKTIIERYPEEVSLKTFYISEQIIAINIGPYKNEFLEEYNVSENNEYFSSENGVLYNKDKTILIDYPNNKKDTSFVVPDTVTKIDFKYFDFIKNLDSIQIGKNVREIEWGLSGDEYTDTKPVNLKKVIGYKNSSAEIFANNWQLEFVEISE